MEPTQPIEALSSQMGVPSQPSQQLAPSPTLAPSSLVPGSATQLSPVGQPKPGILNPPMPSLTSNDLTRATTRGGAVSPPPSGSLSPIGINVEELRQLDPDSLGTLTIEEGGFGTLMWDGSPRRKIERLLPKLPTRSTSRTMRGLMRRLLLSKAKAPAGEPLVPGQKDLIGTRLALLSAMGDLSGFPA